MYMFKEYLLEKSVLAAQGEYVYDSLVVSVCPSKLLPEQDPLVTKTLKLFCRIDGQVTDKVESVKKNII